MMSQLTKYSQDLFSEKVVDVFGANASDVALIDLWWRQLPITTNWLARFLDLSVAMPGNSPEFVDLNAAVRGANEAFKAINGKLSALLGMPNDGFLMRLWVRPALSVVGMRDPRAKIIEELAERINSFRNQYMTEENDQITAVCEAMMVVSRNDDMKVRMKVAQWGFEEMFRLFKLYELEVKVGGVGELSTVDELEVEKIELADAIRTDAWSSEKREKFRRIFKRLRYAMDELKFETDTKRDFTRAFDYATGHVGASVSAIDILRVIEKVWQGIKADDTLVDFWKSEQEALEEKTEQ